MFNRISLIAFTSFGVITLLWALQFCVVRSSDFATYRVSMEQGKQPTAKETLSTSTHQMRQGVRKDIWFAQEDGSRLHYRIESASSLLTLVPNQNKVDVIENLEHIKCWMQDKLYSGEGKTMQQARYLEADQGSYHYLTQQFIAQSVALSLHRLPGHLLPASFDPKTAFLRGIAQDVSFSVSGKLPQFQAQHFKATLKPNEG